MFDEVPKTDRKSNVKLCFSAYFRFSVPTAMVDHQMALNRTGTN
jgi:hypothetical protein